MKYSEVISIAVQAAISAMRERDELDIKASDSEAWFSMYKAQCVATDEFKKKAEAKSDSVLSARVKELETDLMIMNQRFADVQNELMALQWAAKSKELVA